MILSDMCPLVSGITTKDAARSCELGVRALSLAVGKISTADSDDTGLEQFLSAIEPDEDEAGVLRRGGNLVIKLLENEDVPGWYPIIIYCEHTEFMFLDQFLTNWYDVYCNLFYVLNYFIICYC